jgi:hypothetical protein
MPLKKKEELMMMMIIIIIIIIISKITKSFSWEAALHILLFVTTA